MNATYLLSLLPLLACPLLMGGMMWLMMRMNKVQDQPTTATHHQEVPASTGRLAVDPTADDRLAGLRAQLGEVEAQQVALAVRLGLPSGGDQSAGVPASRESAASARRSA